MKVSAWLMGQLLLASVIGITAAIGLWLLNILYFYVLALIAAIGEMIPMIGPVLAALPAIAVAFTVSPAAAAWVTLYYVAQRQLETTCWCPRSWSGRSGSAR